MNWQEGRQALPNEGLRTIILRSDYDSIVVQAATPVDVERFAQGAEVDLRLIQRTGTIPLAVASELLVRSPHDALGRLRPGDVIHDSVGAIIGWVERFDLQIHHEHIETTVYGGPVKHYAQGMRHITFTIVGRG